MFASAGKALSLIFDPRFFGVVLKSAGLTLLLYVILLALTLFGVHHLPALRWHWLNVALDWLAPIVLTFLFLYLGAPVAALFATLFLDDIAGAVEGRNYPGDPKGTSAKFSVNFYTGLRMTLWLVVINILLLPFHVFLPGIAGVLTIIADGWLLGWQYFELVALRHVPRAKADELRKRYAGPIFLGGILIALLALLPIADLVAPLFGAALMAHAVRRFSQTA